MAENKKIGVFITSAFGIGEVIDCNKLIEELQNDDGVVVCKILDNLCTPDGAELIRKEIEEHQLNSVVLGASSPRYHSELFKFDNAFVERVNLREQVAWCHTPNDKETQLLATDYMRMGLAKARLAENPIPQVLDITETVLVIGAGITGLNAAIASAKAGYNVVLTEKEKELGGFYRKMYKLTPSESPYLELELNTCDDIIAEAKSHPKIKILTECEILKTSGQPGMFDVIAKIAGEEISFKAGSIIQATGWKPYNAKKLSKFGYGRYKNVITNVEMEELAKNNNIKRQFDGEDLKSVVFIQCAGSRDKEHLPYCSSICCGVSLKQALYVREKFPDARIFVIYKDMRTLGNNELFYKRVQTEDKIFMTKGEISELVENENGEITVNVDKTLVGESIAINADLVVLACGIVPTTLVEHISEEDEKPEEIEKADAKETTEDGKKMAAGAESGAKILNLNYRQGTDLPTLHYGFPDSHYICFPYETRRTGIYAAGAVRSPMDTVGSRNDAFGAAMKAIQVIEHTKNGMAVHPRSWDKSYPDFFLQRCTQCKRCTEECPFGTLDEDSKGTPKPNPNRCRRCGICMGACPERIISFKDYSVHIISMMIKSIHIPKEEDEGGATPRIIAFMCENDAYPSLDVVGRKRMLYSPHIRVIPVRCLGSVSTSWIADSLSQGFDGAILIGCKYGEDYQCHYIRGSELANIRMENVQEKLKQLVLEPERVEIHTLSIDEYDKIPDIFNKFAEAIERVGPNPYKEM